MTMTTPTPVTQSLLPCPNPWCSRRSPPRVFENICGTSWSVECAECDIHCSWKASPEDAATNWNDRHLTAAINEEPACPHCDGTGDVHRADGEWLGECHCNTRSSSTASSVNVGAALKPFADPYAEWEKDQANGATASGPQKYVRLWHFRDAAAALAASSRPASAGALAYFIGKRTALTDTKGDRPMGDR